MRDTWGGLGYDELVRIAQESGGVLSDTGPSGSAVKDVWGGRGLEELVRIAEESGGTPLLGSPQPPNLGVVGTEQGVGIEGSLKAWDGPPQFPGGQISSSPVPLGAEREKKSEGPLERIINAITGEDYKTKETEQSESLEKMPELFQLNKGSAKSTFAALLSNPTEMQKIIAKNSPDVKSWMDEKGNIIYRSAVDGKLYANRPGLSSTDALQALAGMLTAVPALRAARIPAAIIANAAIQGGIEAGESAVGGEFNPGTAALSGALGGASAAAGPALGALGSKVRGMMPSKGAGGAQGAVKGHEGAGAARQGAAEGGAVGGGGMGPSLPAGGAGGEGFEQFGETPIRDLAQLFSDANRGVGPKSHAAREEIARLMAVDPKVTKAIEETGLEIPIDMLSRNPQIVALSNQARSQVGSPAESTFSREFTQLTNQADDLVREISSSGGSLSEISDSVKTSMTGVVKDIKDRENDIYTKIDKLVPEKELVQSPNLSRVLDEIKEGVGRDFMTPIEKRLANMLRESGGRIRKGVYKRVKQQIYKAMTGKDSPFSSLDDFNLKRLYQAAVDDQVDSVRGAAGEKAANQLIEGHLLTVKRKAVEEDAKYLFGKDLSSSLVPLVKRSVATAGRGDKDGFMEIIRRIPEEFRKDSVAVALADLSKKRGGSQAFSFDNFHGIMEGINKSPSVRKEMRGTLGDESMRVLDNLLSLSKQVRTATSRQYTTGKSLQHSNEAAGRLVERIMQNAMTQRVVGLGLSMIPGAGVVTPDVFKMMSKSRSIDLEGVNGLLRDGGFKALVLEVARTDAANPATVGKVAASQAFKSFLKKTYKGDPRDVSKYLSRMGEKERRNYLNLVVQGAQGLFDGM